MKKESGDPAPLTSAPVDGKEGVRTTVSSSQPAESAAAQTETISIWEQRRVCMRLGKKLLSAVTGVAVVYLFLSVFETVLRLAAGQLFGKITALLQQGAGGDSWVLGTFIFWVAAAVVTLILPLFLKHVTALMDGRMANRLRERLFSRLLHQPADFYHKNDPGRLTSITNQMSLEAQMTLRQLVLDPLVQAASLLLSAGIILWNLARVQTGGQNPFVWIGVVLVFLFALISPWLVARLSGRLQSAATEMRDQNLALAGLVNGSMQSPEEIQAFRAEEMITEKHDRQLASLMRARLRQTFNVQLLNSIDDVPLLFVRVGLVGFAIFGGVASGAGSDPALAGAVVAILLQAPTLMAPIQAISTYISMLRLNWPSIETVDGILSSEPGSKDLPGGAGDRFCRCRLLGARSLFRLRP